MKTFVITAALATFLSGAAFAETGNSAIVILPPAVPGSAPTNYLLDDLTGKKVYGVNNEEIGEIEDFVVGTNGAVKAAVVDVGGFLGLGQKEVLVDWSALKIAVENDKVRIRAPSLTKEQLQAAADTDVKALVIERD